MTNEEARTFILQNFFDGDDNINAVTGDEETEAMVLAIKALEKQTPVKPERLDDGDCIGGVYACPICGNRVGEEINRCLNCERPLDWSIVRHKK